MDQEMGMMSGWTRSQLNIEPSSAQLSLGKASHSSVNLFGFLLHVFFRVKVERFVGWF